MPVHVDLMLFAHVSARPEAQLDLAQAALLIAETEYRGLDVDRYLRMLDDLGVQARHELDRVGRGAGVPLTGERAIEPLLRWMFEDACFLGNSMDYYDPRNSLLNQVLERRTGIPISLAVVLMEVGKRAGVDVQGVSFPGHFLARVESPRGPVFIDPFDGRVLSREDIRGLYARAMGEKRDPDPRLLEPATKRQILVRMLGNLRGIYAARGDRERLRVVLERMAVLAPSEELRGQLEELGGIEHLPSFGFTTH